MVEGGESVVVYDNLASGSAERIESLAPLEIGDIRDAELVRSVLLKYKFDGIIHMAAEKSVEESKRFPEKYDEVNRLGSELLLDVAKDCQVEAFLFSSSAAVYGNPSTGFVDENSLTLPISPYGETKLMAERALNKLVNERVLRGTSLRYFNVAGAVSKKMADTSKSNLIPMVLDAIKDGQRPRIFGNDYPTKDGTCIRDYVHVEDIAAAHLIAGKALFTSALPPCFNIGTGVGYSVQEIVSALLRESGSGLLPSVVPARSGDPASLVANVSLAKEVLNFTASRQLDEIVHSSVAFQS
ncbi:UDP-glucose 4-epimerase [mine drainage metagenome]|uniref:UDP-glucose 4-epimerase n=1 Tax=mine drainage metagenome TaxID=410659 RepID=A0A1J5QMZ1_9ZZZZ